MGGRRTKLTLQRVERRAQPADLLFLAAGQRGQLLAQSLEFAPQWFVVRFH